MFFLKSAEIEHPHKTSRSWMPFKNKFYRIHLRSSRTNPHKRSIGDRLRSNLHVRSGRGVSKVWRSSGCKRTVAPGKNRGSPCASNRPIAFDASLVPESKQRSRASLGSLLEAVSEGFNKAELYERLARKSDAELAALGLRREDLPRFVMFGKT
jgi:hypothetical protein